MSKFKFFSGKTPFFSTPKPLSKHLHFSSEQHPSLPNFSNKNPHPIDNLATPHDTLADTPVTSNTDTPINIYSRINYHFPPHFC